jgi:drug/metabolite transporter (DMT)-like permease
VTPQGWLAPGLLVLNGALIAATYACAKVAGAHGVSAFSVLAWQVGFAAVALTAIVSIRGEWPTLTGANLRYAAVAGVLGITGPNLVTFTALAHVPAGLIGVITSLSALFTYLMVILLRAEPPNFVRTTGVVAGLVGVAGIVLPRGSLPSPEAVPWALFAIVAPMLLAGGNVFRSIAWPHGLRPLSAAALLLVLQAVILVPSAMMGGHFEIPTSALREEDIALLMAGIFTTAFFLGAFELQKRGGPLVVGQLGYVITIASLGIGVMVFDERHTATTLAAVGVVLVGVALVNHRPVRT